MYVGDGLRIFDIVLASADRITVCAHKMEVNAVGDLLLWRVYVEGNSLVRAIAKGNWMEALPREEEDEAAT